MKRVFAWLLPMNSKLWRAWITAYFLDIPLFSIFAKVLERLWGADPSELEQMLASEVSDLQFLAGGAFLLLIVGTILIGTPLIASHKGRRWWLWLIFTPFGGFAPLLAVAFAERPLSQDEKDTRAIEDALRAHRSRR